MRSNALKKLIPSGLEFLTTGAEQSEALAARGGGAPRNKSSNADSTFEQPGCYSPYHARVISHAMITAPPSASTARNAPAAIPHAADRLHAHHMKRDTISVPSPTATRTSAAVAMLFAGRF